jgi:hypothetical protein
MPFVGGVRCSFCGKDAGSVDSSAIGATEDAVRRASSVRWRHNAYFARPSYYAAGRTKSPAAALSPTARSSPSTRSVICPAEGVDDAISTSVPGARPCS